MYILKKENNSYKYSYIYIEDGRNLEEMQDIGEKGFASEFIIVNDNEFNKECAVLVSNIEEYKNSSEYMGEIEAKVKLDILKNSFDYVTNTTVVIK